MYAFRTESSVWVSSRGVMICGIFSWRSLAPLITRKYHLTSEANLGIVADHIFVFMTTMHHFSVSHFHQDSPSGHNAKRVVDLFTEHSNEVFNVKITSTITGSQLHKSLFEYGGKGDSNPRCVAHPIKQESIIISRTQISPVCFQKKNVILTNRYCGNLKLKRDF